MESEFKPETKLNAQYFEERLLKENERSVEWLLDQLRPESSLRDRILIKSITGFDYSENDEDNRQKKVSNFNFGKDKEEHDL